MMAKVDKKNKYIHNETTHNITAPSIIVPLVLDFVPVKSVVDVGCGIGTWLKAFKNNNVKDVLGIDGKWINKDLLYKYISENEFTCLDLEMPIQLNKTFDLVISLEVAEHISEEKAAIFVNSLVNLGKIILFSAAIPGQGGFNHVNEQWPSYWMKKFERHNYYFHDLIRPKIWNNSQIEYFYKQNIFVIAHQDIKLPSNDYISFDNIVHPDCFVNKVSYIQKIESGKRGISYYLNLLGKRFNNYIKKKTN